MDRDGKKSVGRPDEKTSAEAPDDEEGSDSNKIDDFRMRMNCPRTKPRLTWTFGGGSEKRSGKSHGLMMTLSQMLDIIGVVNRKIFLTHYRSLKLAKA